MKKLVLGIIGVLWGALILGGALFRGNPGSTNDAYSTGSLAGTIFGLVIFIAGLLSIIKWTKQRKSKPQQ